MFTTIPGIVGKLIAWGEKLNDNDVTWEIAKKVQHVAMVTDVGAGYVSVVEAMPNGAREDQIIDDGSLIWVRPGYAYPDIAYKAAMMARHFIGTPYSFLDYAALTAHHLHLPVPWLDRYITSTRHMICSQLVDQALFGAHYHVFNDGRLPQDVTPAALYVGVLALGGYVL